MLSVPPTLSSFFTAKPNRHRSPNQVKFRTRSCSNVPNHQEIDMVRTKSGAYAPKPKKVAVLWDLDNKPPRGQPYEAATQLKCLAARFGHVADVSAYANRHAFIHLPQWVAEERAQRRNLDRLERKGVVQPSQPYACSVCGRKFPTNLDLKKHFKQLHERERQKKLNRMRSLKGKKRQRFKERFIDGNDKYNEAARSLLTQKVGYGLAQELRRAGVYVKTVTDKPQAADWALKRRMAHSMNSGIDWIVLVSDDSDFTETLRKAREEGGLGTVVVGDRDGALGKYADVWVDWGRVESGEIEESDLVFRRRANSSGFSISEFDGELMTSVEMEIGGLRSTEDDWIRLRLDDDIDDDDSEDGDYFLDSDDEGGEEGFEDEVDVFF